MLDDKISGGSQQTCLVILGEQQPHQNSTTDIRTTRYEGENQILMQLHTHRKLRGGWAKVAVHKRGTKNIDAFANKKSRAA